MRNEFTAIFELYEESPEPFYFARCAELVLSHLWNSSYREATCSAVPCKPMQHLPNPTFDFTVD